MGKLKAAAMLFCTNPYSLTVAAYPNNRSVIRPRRMYIRSRALVISGQKVRTVTVVRVASAIGLRATTMASGGPILHHNQYRLCIPL